ncbi:hypothetical protein QCA50_019512 [Cerrena zonata]|uniref:Uncharacterized protein n=1 Tax=Cerrena zonata TaxID=2478898 RepID=A0AAW0FJG6_9APHY
MHIPVLESLIGFTSGRKPPPPVGDSDVLQGLEKQIPAEIVQRVLKHYLPSVLRAHNAPLFYYREVQEPSDKRRTQRAHIDEYRKQVHFARRVNRTWYSAALDYLYTYPILLTYRQIAALSDTLKMYPKMCIARDLTVVYDHRLHYSPEKFMSILQTSTHLDTLSIMYRETRDFSVSLFKRRFDALVNVAPRLRKLTLYGGHDWSTELKLSFPNLEYLCLQYLGISDANILCGDLPSLHTLQLVQVNFAASHIVWQNIGNLPNLNSLEVYLTNSAQMFSFMENSHFMSSKSIKYLTVGIIDSVSSIRMNMWRLLHELIHLTVLLNTKLQQVPYQRHVADGMSAFLQYTAKYHSLKDIQMVTQFGFGETEDRENEGTNPGENCALEKARKNTDAFFSGRETEDQDEEIPPKVSLGGLACARRNRIKVKTVWCGQCKFSILAYRVSILKSIGIDLAAFVNYSAAGSTRTCHKI